MLYPSVAARLSACSWSSALPSSLAEVAVVPAAVVGSGQAVGPAAAVDSGQAVVPATVVGSGLVVDPAAVEGSGLAAVQAMALVAA